MIPDANIKFQSMQTVEDGTAESDLLRVLEKHYSEETAIGLSVDGQRAVATLSLVMIRLLIGFPPETQREICDTIAKVALRERLKAIASSQPGGKA